MKFFKSLLCSFSFGGGLFGFFLSLFLIFLVNASLFKSSNLKKKKLISQFEVKKTIQKKIKKAKRKKITKKADNLKPDLKNLISGMNFGIPAFEVEFGSGSDFLKNGNYVNGKNVEQRPKIIYRPDLDFPEKALEEQISGYVVFGIFVDETGALKKIDLLESSPKGVFDEVALKHIKRWKFKPAVHKGVQVATWQEQRISFDAEGGGV